MYLNKKTGEHLLSCSLPGKLVWEIANEQRDHSDGESFSWRFLPAVEAIPSRDDQHKTIKYIFNASMELIRETFRITPGFGDMVGELGLLFFHQCRQMSQPEPYKSYRNRMDNHLIRRVSEAGFWITDREHNTTYSRYHSKPLPDPSRSMSECARVFVSSVNVIGEVAWKALDNVLIDLRDGKHLNP